MRLGNVNTIFFWENMFNFFISQGEFRLLLVPSASVLVPTPEAAKAAEGRRRRRSKGGRSRRGTEEEEARKKAIVRPPPWTENGGEEW